MGVMPACDVCHGLVADRADASLGLPQGHQPTPSVQGLCHLHPEACFPIEFPRRGVGGAIPLARGVPGYWCCRGPAKQIAEGVAALGACCAEAAPVVVFVSPTIASLAPSLAFLRLAPPCPSPQGFEAGRLAMDKGCRGDCVSVTVGPAPYCGSECGEQPVCRRRFLLLRCPCGGPCGTLCR